MGTKNQSGAKKILLISLSLSLLVGGGVLFLTYSLGGFFSPFSYLFIDVVISLLVTIVVFSFWALFSIWQTH